MKRIYWQMGCLAAAPLLLAGCVDDNYDFDDIDTTTRITVNDLTVPLNLKPIVLENIIDLEGNENISVVEVGGTKVYAIEKSGEISTDVVSVNPIQIVSPAIAPTSISLSAVSGRSQTSARRVVVEDFAVEYPITSSLASRFDFKAEGIDEAVRSLTEVTTVSPASITIRLVFPSSLASMIGRVEFRGAQVDLPKGLYYGDNQGARCNHGTYNPETGLLTLDESIDFSSSQNAIEISLEFTRLDTSVAGIDIANQELEYSGSLGLRAQGSILLTPRLSQTLPSDFNLESQYDVASFYVATFSGQLDYPLEGIVIDPIDLSGLPEFLDDPETQLILGNPQIYVGALNTTADYQTGLRGQLALNSLWAQDGEQHLSPMFNVGWDRGPVVYNIAMAPDTQDLAMLDKYPNPARYTFIELSNILTSFNINHSLGLPDKIGVELLDLHFYGNAKRFPVKNGPDTNAGTIAPLKGSYTFYTPFSFRDGSRIVYSKTETGLASEDFDKLYVSRLHLTAQATNTLPVTVTLSAYPVDEAGIRIGECIQGIELLPGASQTVALEIVGIDNRPFNRIDGINYRAIVAADTDEKALSPDQTITLSDLRITVDGYYETDF